MKAPRLVHGGEPTRGTTKQPTPQKQGHRRKPAPANGFERYSFRSNSKDAEMWADYWVFKAAGLLCQWRELYKARLPIKPNATP